MDSGFVFAGAAETAGSARSGAEDFGEGVEVGDGGWGIALLAPGFRTGRFPISDFRDAVPKAKVAEVF